MGMNMIITLIMGITMSTIIGTAIGPSLIEGIKITKVKNRTINNQEVIFEAIKRYTTMKQETPEDIDDLFSADYIDEKVNDNGFGGTYEIEVNKALGVAKITTIIKDPKAQETFLKSFKGVSKPSCTGNIVNGVCETNEFETKYVIPNDIMHGNALLMTGIPIGSTSPDSDTNKYWYDTSSGKAILKLYDNDNSKWTEVNLGTSSSPDDDIKFIAGNAKIFGSYSYSSLNASNTTFLEIIPSKLGSFNIEYNSMGASYHYSLEFYLNGIKIDYIDNAKATTGYKQILFFKAYDKIEVKRINNYGYIYNFGIYVTPESAGPPDLNITIFK